MRSTTECAVKRPYENRSPTIQYYQTRPLAERWSFQILRGALDWLEGIHHGRFPSGHTEVTLQVWWSAWRISKSLFWT